MIDMAMLLLPQVLFILSPALLPAAVHVVGAVQDRRAGVVTSV